MTPSRFIFMLTRNDVTIAEARRVFAEIADLPIPFVGFKDIGLPVAELTALAKEIRANGQEVMLEVVSQTRDDELKSIRAGVDIGVDYVLGGTHADAAVKILEGSGIRYMPFPGRIVGHPSHLHGTPAEIVDSARSLSEKEGVAGLDLLAYRFAGNVEPLIAAVVKAVDCPVIVAGSIASAERIRAVSRLGAWGFTVGSAVFDNSFAGEKTLRGQISAILAAADESKPDNHKAS
jgi:hypothetical protein